MNRIVKGCKPHVKGAFIAQNRAFRHLAIKKHSFSVLHILEVAMKVKCSSQNICICKNRVNVNLQGLDPLEIIFSQSHSSSRARHPWQINVSVNAYLSHTLMISEVKFDVGLLGPFLNGS